MQLITANWSFGLPSPFTVNPCMYTRPLSVMEIVGSVPPETFVNGGAVLGDERQAVKAKDIHTLVARPSNVDGVIFRRVEWTPAQC